MKDICAKFWRQISNSCAAEENSDFTVTKNQNIHIQEQQLHENTADTLHNMTAIGRHHTGNIDCK